MSKIYLIILIAFIRLLLFGEAKDLVISDKSA